MSESEDIITDIVRHLRSLRRRVAFSIVVVTPDERFRSPRPPSLRLLRPPVMSTPNHLLLAAVIALYQGILATQGVPKAAYDQLPPTHYLMVRGASCASDAVEVASLIQSETARETYARLVFVTANKEGGCQADPQCPPGTPSEKCNDDGRSCGVMQIQEPHKIIEGATCAKVRADRKLGMRVGLALMLQLGKRCGSIGAGLNVYATGRDCKVGGKPDAPIPLVAERCKLAGVDCTAPWSPGA